MSIYQYTNPSACCSVVVASSWSRISKLFSLVRLSPPSVAPVCRHNMRYPQSRIPESQNPGNPESRNRGGGYLTCGIYGISEFIIYNLWLSARGNHPSLDPSDPQLMELIAKEEGKSPIEPFLNFVVRASTNACAINWRKTKRFSTCEADARLSGL